ncbi:MAG TPA: gamma carbonic anhydrase family protein [Rhizomicrobium sp.]|jgi:carbonic anhydrase/acetyltransferase-like protein (isoleucine patch superfamily)|nr:gamma carbonic anhydrase family protein [Rhizomicrobium sp.]
MPIYALDGVVPEIAEDCWIAPDAVLIGKVQLLKGASIWFGAVLRGDNDWITIGPNSNVQDHSIIHADPGQPVTIGRGVTIGHRVIVHSASVGDDTLIGMGAILLNRARIGARSLVGAGALATEDKSFEDGKMILGAPARAVRDLSPEQISGIEKSAAIYLANARRYAAKLKPA